ncbi:hypothetical protein [Natronococcus occultus]|uniref:Uncharacterized protein n=1 Tax=Natronococcus occultus SP4 TaxID=694430 RepID=L0JVG0_9EURY|nr:hypothetical protein [Natronococcus occultus]AGB36109.1 hypothetical protein Natoc_0232 [Natronococcus occultus SP4]
MSTILLVAIVGIPLAWHLGLTAFVYYDSGRVGLEPTRKWVAITFAIPIFGFFIYLFERSELDYDPESDPYRGQNYNIHPSRADDAPVSSRGDDREESEELQEPNGSGAEDER